MYLPSVSILPRKFLRKQRHFISNIDTLTRFKDWSISWNGANHCAECKQMAVFLSDKVQRQIVYRNSGKQKRTHVRATMNRVHCVKAVEDYSSVTVTKERNPRVTVGSFFSNFFSKFSYIFSSFLSFYLFSLLSNFMSINQL